MDAERHPKAYISSSWESHLREAIDSWGVKIRDTTVRSFWFMGESTLGVPFQGTAPTLFCAEFRMCINKEKALVKDHKNISPPSGERKRPGIFNSKFRRDIWIRRRLGAFLPSKDRAADTTKPE